MRFFLVVLTFAMGMAGSAGAQSPAQTIHDTYCIACHGTEIYTREPRLANDYRTLREQVAYWQGIVDLNWDDSTIDQVTGWLAERFYGLDCPQLC
ncbi:MAG: hypothetical protein PVH25_07380 [Burkholderiales bacterium]|jgi:hypothetical protein